MRLMIHLKRIYDAPAADDGFRVLVDRLWPRGVRKAGARLDLWLKEVGPSNALRQWFGHDPVRYAEFKRRYEAELRQNPAFQTLQGLAADHDVVTLLYAAHDAEYNQAQVLRALLQQQLAS